METLKCNKCEVDKDVSEYYKDNRGKVSKLRQPCKQCNREAEKIKRERYKVQEKKIPEKKTCTSCCIEKPSECFHKRGDTPTGLRDKCKDCYNNGGRVYYESNKEKVLERTGNYASEHREDYARRKRERYKEDPDKYKLKDKEYKENNKERIREWEKEYRQRPHVKAKSREYYLKYVSDPIVRERKKQTARDWAKKNKDKICYYSSMRRAKLKNATPPWGDLEIIKSFYTEASYFSETVDHIIPLTHDLVCGLHCEFNLQTISFSENSSKNNSFEPCEHELPEFFEDKKEK